MSAAVLPEPLTAHEAYERALEGRPLYGEEQMRVVSIASNAALWSAYADGRDDEAESAPRRIEDDPMSAPHWIAAPERLHPWLWLVYAAAFVFGCYGLALLLPVAR